MTDATSRFVPADRSATSRPTSSRGSSPCVTRRWRAASGSSTWEWAIPTAARRSTSWRRWSTRCAIRAPTCIATPPSTAPRRCAARSPGGTRRRFGVTLDPDTQTLPLIGSKEGLANLMRTCLNIGRHDHHPQSVLSRLLRRRAPVRSAHLGDGAARRPRLPARLRRHPGRGGGRRADAAAELSRTTPPAACARCRSWRRRWTSACATTSCSCPTSPTAN